MGSDNDEVIIEHEQIVGIVTEELQRPGAERNRAMMENSTVGQARRSWEVALSFAGAQRGYVEQVAAALKVRGVRCFFDADEQIELWGRYLTEELPTIYAEQSDVVVVFVSADYASQDWARLERRAALNRAIRERREYVLPARFDDTILPGLLSEMVAIDLRKYTPNDFARIILEKLKSLGVSVVQRVEGSFDVPLDDVVTGRSRPWMVPPLDRMVQRPELGDRLVAALTAQRTALVGLTTSLKGAGGFGKTRLATWVCQLPEINQRYPGGVLWTTLGQDVEGVALAEKINDLAYALCGERPPVSDPDVAGAQLGRLLDAHDPVLLVVDDVWNESQLRSFRIGGRNCTRLVTTRIGDVLPIGELCIPVDAMSDEESRLLVSDRVTRLSDHAAELLSKAAGRWPVLLNLINGVLRRRVERGQNADSAAGEIVRRLIAEGPTTFDPAHSADRSQAVRATINASLIMLAESDQRRYMDLGIFLEDVEIPRDVLSLLWDECDVDALCENLVGLGLAVEYRMEFPGPRLLLHDVMHSFLQARLSPEERVALHRRLIAAAERLLLKGTRDGFRPWWTLPEDARYFWRFLPYHLQEAGEMHELAAVTFDLRWVEAKTRLFESVIGAVGDLQMVDTPTAHILERVLRREAHVLGPIRPAAALGATLASRLDGVTGLAEIVNRYRTLLTRPLLRPVWPLPDQVDPADSAAMAGHTGGVTRCAFSPDGMSVVTVSDDGTARLWRVADGAEQMVLAGHIGGVWGCAFSPDGALLATAGDDGTARLWRVADGAEQIVLAGHVGRASCCAFSPDGALLATAGDDGTARLWRVADGTARTALTGHSSRVWGCAFSPDGALLATASQDGTARLWQLADGSELAVLVGHTSRVWSCSFSSDGILLATTSHDGTARLWDVADRSEHALLAGPNSRVWSCAFSSDGKLLATTSNDGTVRLWQVADSAEQLALTGHASRVNCCAFSPDGTLLATTSNDGTARLWEVANGRTRAILRGHTDWVRDCAFSPDGRMLATASHDRTVRLWRVTDGLEQAVLTGHTDLVWGCAYALDGSLLVSSGMDRTVRLWRIADSSDQGILTGHTDLVNSCAFSPDTRLVASASDDGTARLWNLESRSELTVLEGHNSWVESCVFSPDGSLLATASNDQTIRLWDVASREIHCAIRVAAPLAGIAWHPAGRLICAVGGAGVYLLSYEP